ncbi:hypothetical protein TNCT_117211 [Trichonephila clavata]|uniref:Uncharacterized protein n=1 Tax=Trichonephila clavata TaxID=2740835 RepID=A0A8X6L4Y3_TRICU|nr:hypothetical protein TNCT_117211 [Trichonephila clavata]
MTQNLQGTDNDSWVVVILRRPLQGLRDIMCSQVVDDRTVDIYSSHNFRRSFPQNGNVRLCTNVCFPSKAVNDSVLNFDTRTGRDKPKQT